MNEEKEKFAKDIATLKKVGLTPVEKDAMLATLTKQIGNMPVPSGWVVFFRPMVYLSSVLAILVVITSGGMLASEKAVPGDLLYPLKVDFYEPVRDALTVGTSAKAAWETDKATRRLQEAENLITTGQLDEAKKVEIQQQFNQSVDSFNNFQQQAESSGEATTTENLDINFQAKVDDQGQRLKKAKESVSVEHKKDISDLEQTIENGIEKVHQRMKSGGKHSRNE